MSGSGARIVLEGLGLAYSGSGVWALANVSGTVEPGEELWVTGANAAGKSSLMLMLAGVIPEVIEATIAGHVEVSATNGRSPVVSAVLQDSGVYLFRTVYDEIAFVLQNAGIEPRLVPEEVAQALRVVGIEQLEGRLMHTLSGGERQKVAVSAALAVAPDVLLLDEPFEQLDPASAAEVFAIARGRAGDGLTLVVATRQGGRVPEEARELHLVEGRLAARDVGPVRASARVPVAEPGGPLLELEGVTHRYSATCGIEGISIAVRAGESVALLGPNGAGKTTLMKHADGLLRPQSGVVSVAGSDIAERPVWDVARDVGMLFQSPEDQIFNRTVGREVAWGLRARGVDEQSADAATLEVLEELGIASLAGENPHELTASQRQLVAFASILVAAPRLYVLDEPTKALDARAAEIVAGAVDRRLAAGAGVLLVTHDLDFARRLADRVVVLVDGEVVWQGATEQLLADRDLLETARLLD